MRRSIIALLLFCVSGSAWAQDAIQSADGRYGIVRGDRGPRVEDERGASVPLNIPEAVHLRHLASLRGGWIASGSQIVGARQELFLRMLDPGGLKRIPAPGFRSGVIRKQPVILSDGETLLGMLWLEGDTPGRLAVRASEWLGITWSRPVTVSALGPGTQTALAATVLGDGSWLAVWSRFDGQDDEVVYSLGFGSSWTEPSPLSANAVPDILPTLAPTEQGALVAWNQYDGEEYRVVSAQLLEGRWIQGETQARGSFHPRFVMDEDRPTLLFYAIEGSWRVHQMDRTGAVLRRGSAPAESTDRPLLFSSRIEPEEEGPSTLRLRRAGSGNRVAPRWEKQR